jgi:hypothetical protein
MRRTILLVATMPLTLLVVSGVALAVTRIGSDGPDTLRGTNKADNLVGLDGNDRLFSLAGRDALLGGPGKDAVWGGRIVGPCCEDNDYSVSAGAGNDAVWVLNFSPRGKDFLSCGSGFDRVMADRTDVIAPDCERVFFGRRHIDEFLDSIPESFLEGLPQL